MRRTVLPILLAAATQVIIVAPSLAGLPQQRGSELLRAWLQGPESLLLLPAEIALLGQVPDDATAQEYVRWFWRRRDPDPSTANNELRIQFLERLSTIERDFAEVGVPGPAWATARGRMYLLLGAPDATYTSLTRYNIDGRLRSLEIWEYARDAGTVRFAFAETSAGIRLIVSDPRQRLSPEQEDFLAAAKQQLVRDASVPGFGVLADHRHETLTAQVDAGYRAGGVLAHARLALRDLIGEPDETGLNYKLRVLAIGPASEAPEELGEISIRLALSEVGGSGGQSLDLALWFPEPSGGVSGLQLVEVPTGRVATLEVAGETALPDEFAVALELAQVPLRSGQGLAVAYLPTCEKRPVAVARLVAPAGPVAGLDGEPPTGTLMALLPLAPHPTR